MSQLIESNPYVEDNIPLFNMLYGEHLISLGGTAAIDNLFSGIAVSQLNALDVGFGLGGVSFYLAKKYKMKVSGVEIHLWMVTYAKHRAPADVKQQLDFNIYNNDGTIPYAAQSFDIAYSKGVFNHIDDKVNLLHDIHRVLKPHGLLVIADWIAPHSVTKQGSLIYETKRSYQKVLSESYFEEVAFRDDTELFIRYVNMLLDNINKHQHSIKNQYGFELIELLQGYHHNLIKRMVSGDQIAIRIVAKKI